MQHVHRLAFALCQAVPEDHCVLRLQDSGTYLVRSPFLVCCLSGLPPF
jgi:hypothetical protein